MDGGEKPWLTAGGWRGETMAYHFVDVVVKPWLTTGGFCGEIMADH